MNIKLGLKLLFAKKVDGDTTASPPTPTASESMQLIGTTMAEGAIFPPTLRSWWLRGFSQTPPTNTAVRHGDRYDATTWMKDDALVFISEYADD